MGQGCYRDNTSQQACIGRNYHKWMKRCLKYLSSVHRANGAACSCALRGDANGIAAVSVILSLPGRTRIFHSVGCWIKNDIDLLKIQHPYAETAFFGDTVPLQAGVDTFAEIARCLRNSFPIKRLTCHARVSTLWKFKRDAIKIFAQAVWIGYISVLNQEMPGFCAFIGKGKRPKW